MRKYFLGLLCLTVMSSGLRAGSGTSGFEFLRIDMNPRSSAMGGAFIAMRGDIAGIFYNPAGMAFTDEEQFTFSYVNYLLDIGGGQAGYTRRLNGLGQISALISYFNYGEFTETNEFATPTGNTFSASDIVFALSYSDYLETHFSYGVSMKYIHSKIDLYTSGAMAFDFGLIYDAPFEDDLYFGISMLNVGKATSAFIDTKEDLPLSLRLGVTKKLAHLPLEFNLAFNDLNVSESSFADRLSKFSIGGEFTISQVIRLRLGYNNEVHKGLDTGTGAGFSGVSLGFGIYYDKYRFDYGFSSFGDLGSAHRIGFSGAL
jgi:hypothetical protein